MTRTVALLVFWLLLGLICFWTYGPVGFRPQTGHAVLERFTAFFALGGALAWGYPRRPVLAAMIIGVIAVGSEALQMVIPSRDARLIDAVEKLLGGTAGVAVTVLIVLALRNQAGAKP
jgi:VanZ family protein